MRTLFLIKWRERRADFRTDDTSKGELVRIARISSLQNRRFKKRDYSSVEEIQDRRERCEKREVNILKKHPKVLILKMAERMRLISNHIF